jgi:hypothetical protein
VPERRRQPRRLGNRAHVRVRFCLEFKIRRRKASVSKTESPARPSRMSVRTSYNSHGSFCPKTERAARAGCMEKRTTPARVRRPRRGARGLRIVLSANNFRPRERRAAGARHVCCQDSKRKEVLSSVVICLSLRLSSVKFKEDLSHGASE